MAAPQLMTVDEYFRTPETVLPAELRFGVLRVAEAPTPRHQSAVASLFRVLDSYARARNIGRVWLAPLDVVLDEEHALIVQPDLMFISKENDWIVQDRVRGAPDLVVEVLSPRVDCVIRAARFHRGARRHSRTLAVHASVITFASHGSVVLPFPDSRHGARGRLVDERITIVSHHRGSVRCRAARSGRIISQTISR